MSDQATEIRSVLCEKHGPYQSERMFRGFWSACEGCLQEERENRVKAERAEAENREKRAFRSMMIIAGIPERFQGCSLENFNAPDVGQQEARDFARDFALNFTKPENRGRCAMFVGNVGTGKTHLAIGIAWHVMRAHSQKALYTSVQSAIRRVKETWGRQPKETESEAIAALVAPDLLILDEVGVQFGSETERNIMFDILNQRYERLKSTIFISNLNEKEVTAFLGERVVDRMREDRGVIIPFDWESQRRRA